MCIRLHSRRTSPELVRANASIKWHYSKYPDQFFVDTIEENQIWTSTLGLATCKVTMRLLTEHLDGDLSAVRLSVSVARRAPVLDRLVGVTRPGYIAQSEDCCPGQHSSRVTHFGPLDPGGWGPSDVTGEIQILPLRYISIWRHTGTRQHCVEKQNRPGKIEGEGGWSNYGSASLGRVKSEV